MFINVENAKIFSVAFGAKHATPTPILAMAGWIGTWEDWIEPLSILSETRRVTAYDQRGAGSTVALVDSITYARLVDDVLAVLDAHGIEQCVLALFSSVTPVGLGAVLKAPERFSKLVIVNGLYYRPPQPQDTFLIGLQHQYDAALTGFADACISEANSEHIKRWGRQILDRADPNAAIALYETIRGVDIRGDLPMITQPTLVIHGEADRLVPVDSSRWLAKTLPNAELVTIPGAGHVPMMTMPDVVSEHMRRFLDR